MSLILILLSQDGILISEVKSKGDVLIIFNPEFAVFEIIWLFINLSLITILDCIFVFFISWSASPFNSLRVSSSVTNNFVVVPSESL